MKSDLNMEPSKTSLTRLWVNLELIIHLAEKPLSPVEETSCADVDKVLDMTTYEITCMEYDMLKRAALQRQGSQLQGS